MFRRGFSPFDDDDFFGSRPSRYSHSHSPFTPRNGYEEQRRRQAQAYQRAKQQELQRQRELEALRKKRAEEEYIRRLRESERQKNLRRQRQYSVVRGPDGGLYRVPVEYDDNEPVVKPRKRNTPPQYSIVRGPDGGLYRVPSHFVEEEELNTEQRNPASERHLQPDRSDSSHSASSSIYHSADEESVDAPQRNSRVTVNLPNAQKSNTKRRVTVIVEDVPEAEAEDETKSFWRNRHPGPGESWMEPITNM